MIEHKKIVLTFDGGIHPNPGGVPRYGWQVRSEDGNLLSESSGTNPDTEVRTNNVAEYLGLIAGLKFLKESKWTGEIAIKSDSKLVVGQMCDTLAVRQPHLLRLRNEALKTLHEIADKISIDWIPRKKNQDCDKLASGKKKKNLTDQQ